MLWKKHIKSDLQVLILYWRKAQYTNRISVPIMQDFISKYIVPFEDNDVAGSTSYGNMYID